MHLSLGDNDQRIADAYFILAQQLATQRKARRLLRRQRVKLAFVAGESGLPGGGTEGFVLEMVHVLNSCRA